MCIRMYVGMTDIETVSSEEVDLISSLEVSDYILLSYIRILLSEKT